GIDLRLADVATLVRHNLERRIAAGEAVPHQELQAQVEEIGHEIGVRITIIGQGGAVFADSKHDPSRMENHADRPEVLSSWENGSGKAERFSKTLGYHQRYLALPIYVEDRPYATVRASLPLTTLEQRLDALRGALLTGAVAAIFLALGLGFFHAHRITRPLLSMADAAEQIAAGAYGQRVEADRHDELGKLARAFNTMSHELEGSVAALSADHDKLTAILEGMAEGVIAIDRDERVVHMNAVAGQLLEVDSEEVVSHPIWQVTRLHKVPEALSETMETDQPVNRVLRLPGATDRVLELRAAPLRTLEGLAGAVLMLQDMTQLRRLQTIRQDFVANVSHELKTPVTAIRGMVETLLDDPEIDPGLRQRFLERVRTQAERMGNLVTDLLSLSRLESDSEVFEIHRLDLRQPIRESVRLLTHASEARGVRIVSELPTQPIWVEGDEEALRQAVSNLVDNAIKYSPGGSVVRAGIHVSEEAATIEVQDHGIGIAGHHRERLFERFYRVDKARSRELGGTGLGLAIVKHIARALRGDVSVESAPGMGSTFRIRLPLSSRD
ncbi:MAG: ATP-binding protein, partial [Holophagales bacterium]|nr:ATP-binding protein [Holophagales bacterium]